MRTQHLTSNRESIAMRISLHSIIVNVLLSAGKFVAGLLGNSVAMVSDAVHSLSDVFSTFVVMAGVKISGRDSDEDHQYGHERLECAASIVLSVLLALTGLAIGWAGAQKIIHRDTEGLLIPTLMPLVASIVSIVAKEGMYWYTRHYAMEIRSDALMADAWHHRSDALSSVGSFVGILGARMGYPLLDPIASILICLMILQAAYEIFSGAIDKMVDRSCTPEEEAAMLAVIVEEAGVDHVDLLRTRLFGNRIFVDVEISAADDLTLIQAHQIAENVHRAIEEHFPDVKHCMVHINPLSEKEHDY